MMRAVVNTADSEEPIEFRSVDEPTPDADEFLIEVAAFSVNRGELALLRMRPNGWRPGQDVAGTVVAAAENGAGPSVGTRVFGIVDGAGWSEKAALKISRHAELPDAVTFEQAASLPMAGLTALRTVRIGGDLLGRRVLITGANGGVGRFQIELAANAGASVTAVTTRTEKSHELIDLGANEVVSNLDEPTGLYALVLESLGGAALEKSVRKVEPHGTIVIVGNSLNERSSISLYDFIGHEGARLQSFVSYASGSPDDNDLGILASLVEAGKLRPTLGHVGPWSELASAIGLLAERKLSGGKIVLTVS